MRARIGLLVVIVSACGGSTAVPTTPPPTSTESTTTITVPTPSTTAATTSTTAVTTTTTVPPPDALVCRDEGCGATTFDYLIVTRPMFTEALQPFAAWKSAAGHRVGAVTVEWLAGAYEGDHLAEQVKTGIHDLATRSGIRWVLLVGDTEMQAWDFSVGNVLRSYDRDEPWNVPTGYYRRLATDPAGEVLPSDAYFVEATDWDVLGDGLNARPDDLELGEGTLHATVYLGRWPVRTVEQLATITRKTMETAPAQQVLFTADTSLSDGVTTSCSSWPPGPFQDFFCSLDQMATGRSLFYGDAAPHLVTDSRFVSLTNEAAATENVDEFLAFPGAIVAQFHGTFQCWQLTGECLAAHQLVFEHVIPLIEAQVCVIGAFYFDGGRSLAESLMVSATGPAVFTQAPNPTRFIEALRHGTTVGEAFWATAAEWLYWPNVIVLLGDPSLVVVAGP